MLLTVHNRKTYLTINLICTLLTVHKAMWEYLTLLHPRLVEMTRPAVLGGSCVIPQHPALTTLQGSVASVLMVPLAMVLTVLAEVSSLGANYSANQCRYFNISI